MLWRCTFISYPHIRREQVAQQVVHQHDAAAHSSNHIRGWDNRAGGGASFLLIKTQTSREVTALLQPSMDLMSWDVHAAYAPDYEQPIQQLRPVSQQTGSSTGCPCTRRDPVRPSHGSLAREGDCLALSGALCSTSKLWCPRLGTPVREEERYP
jgi:hypothetical protein